MRDATAGATRPFSFLGWVIAAYVAVLWGETLLYEERWPVHPSDVVVLAVIAAAPRAWRRIADPIAILTIALGASLLVATAAAGDAIGVNVAGRLAVQAMLVCVLAEVFAEGGEARRIVARAVVGVAVGAAAVMVVGGVLGASGVLDGLQPVLERPAFVDRIGNPTFGHWPRFTGGFSYSAENAGLWMACATAIVLAARPRWAWLPAVAAVGTLSIGGAAVVAAVVIVLDGRARVIAAIGAVIVTIALQWPVHVGGRESAAVSPAVCDRFPNHLAQWRIGDACEMRRATDGRARTRYELAKAHAIELARAHPLLGVGANGLARHAWSETRADGASYWNPYVSTHGAWHGVAAEQGLVGLVLLGALAVVLARRLARAPRDATWAAVGGVLLVMLAASIDLDVHKQRILWIAIGVAAGITARPGPRRA